MLRDLHRDLVRSSGLARRTDLLRLGHTVSALGRATRSGSISVPRRGWIADSTAPAAALRAVELGGRLGGASALQSYGVWVDDAPLTIAATRTASRLPPCRPGEVRIFANDRFPSFDDNRWRVSVRDAILQLARAADRASVIASIDSALNQRKLQLRELAGLVDALPGRLRIKRADIDGRSMSGTESKLRLRCIETGLATQIQVSIATVGIVDILIDGWLIIEVDSRRFHDGSTSQHRDRVRDGNAILGKWGFLRFDYALVQFDLAWCIDVILARLESGRP